MPVDMPLALLHGNSLDEILLFAIIAYLIFIFVMAQVKARRQRQARLRRRSSPAAGPAHDSAPSDNAEAGE